VFANLDFHSEHLMKGFIFVLFVVFGWPGSASAGSLNDMVKNGTQDVYRGKPQHPTFFKAKTRPHTQFEPQARKPNVGTQRPDNPYNVLRKKSGQGGTAFSN